MTERKPPGMTFTSWIDQQIEEARERGAFDNLPGAGKPLPGGNDADDGQSWIREYARREGVSAEELLPTPLRLRKKAARLAETVPELACEQEVREAVAELNTLIAEWRRIPVGPAIFVPLVSTDAMLARWREAHPAGSLAKTGAGGRPAPVRAEQAPSAQPGGRRRRGRWHGLRGRGRNQP